jgi:hypothetical protein
VDLCEVIVNNREAPAYRVMKLGTVVEIEAECAAFARLKHLPGLEKYVPDAVRLSRSGGPAIIDLSAVGLPWSTQPVATARELIRDPTLVLSQALQEALCEALTKALSIVHGRLRWRAQTVDALLSEWSSRRGGEDLWTSISAGLSALQSEGEVWTSRTNATITFASLGATTRSPEWWRNTSVWKDPRPMPEAEMVHNDLNARNILVFGTQARPIIIDWARLGPGVAFVDYARIEADAVVEVIEHLLSDRYGPLRGEVSVSLQAFDSSHDCSAKCHKDH